MDLSIDNTRNKRKRPGALSSIGRQRERIPWAGADITGAGRARGGVTGGRAGPRQRGAMGPLEEEGRGQSALRAGAGAFRKTRQLK